MSSTVGVPTTPTRSRPSGSHSDTSTPTLTHSTSNRSLDSPAPKSPVVNHHPVIPKNYHPYQIQTTSSSLLTRSNSSPNQPIHSISGHRTSRSMSNLAHTASPGGPSASASESESEEHDRRKSVDSPRPTAMASEKPMMRRSGTLPSFPSLGEVKKEQRREADLPVSQVASALLSKLTLQLKPKTWTPSELASYLSHTLRTGGPVGTGHILPAPLVKDIETWVLRHQVSGRLFLRNGSEGWASSALAPPFLPLLQSISRRLRRSSLTGRLSGPELPLSRVDSHNDTFGSSSVLMEEEEMSPDEELSGVRRLAHRMETSSSASETEESFHHVTPLRPQVTGDSDRSEGWKRWGQHLGKGRARRTSLLSNASTGDGLADNEASPSLSKRILSGGSNSSQESADSEILSTPHLDGESSAASTIKAPPPGLVPAPLPFDSDEEDILTGLRADERVASLSALLGPDAALGKRTPKRQDVTSVTPTRDRISLSAHSPHGDWSAGMEEEAGLSGASSDCEVILLGRRPSGPNSYGTLQGFSPSQPATSSARAPTLAGFRQAQAQSGFPNIPPLGSEASSEDSTTGSDDVGPNARLATARKVTLRPSQIRAASIAAPSEREKEMEAQLSVLLDKVKQLEARLPSAQVVEQRVEPEKQGPLGPPTLRGPVQASNLMGVNITTAVTFAAGVGVGAVMVKLMLGRAR